MRPTPCRPGPGKPWSARGSEDVRHHRRRPDPGAVVAPARPWRSCSERTGSSGCRGTNSSRTWCWDRSAHHLAAALARWDSGAAKVPAVLLEARPRRRPGPGHVQGARTLPSSGGGRTLALPLSRAKRRELTSRRRRGWQGAGRQRQPRAAGGEADQGRARAGAGGHVLVPRRPLVGVAADAGAARRPTQPTRARMHPRCGLGRGGCRDGPPPHHRGPAAAGGERRPRAHPGADVPAPGT